jgi:hypothetical protein
MESILAIELSLLAVPAGIYQSATLLRGAVATSLGVMPKVEEIANRHHVN